MNKERIEKIDDLLDSHSRILQLHRSIIEEIENIDMSIEESIDAMNLFIEMLEHAKKDQK